MYVDLLGFGGSKGVQKRDRGRKYVRYVYLFSKYTIHNIKKYVLNKGMNMGI